MNHFKPRQRKDGKWDYTCRNNDDIWPVGYCDKFRPWTGEMLDMFGLSEDMIQNNPPDLTHYHTDGHATEEEACECYRQYLLNNHLSLGRVASPRGDCLACGEATGMVAMIDSRVFPLCEKHNTREDVERLFPSIGESWES